MLAFQHLSYRHRSGEERKHGHLFQGKKGYTFGINLTARSDISTVEGNIAKKGNKAVF